MPTPQQRASSRARGCCVNCGRPSRAPRCPACLATQRAYNQARYGRLPAEGRCVQCQKPRTKGARCKACKAYMRARAAVRAAVEAEVAVRPA